MTRSSMACITGRLISGCVMEGTIIEDISMHYGNGEK